MDRNPTARRRARVALGRLRVDGTGARTPDLPGRAVLTGLVVMHEHLVYPSGSGSNAQAFSLVVRGQVGLH